MKRAFSLIVFFIITLSFSKSTEAQVSKKFGKEVSALINADVKSILGDKISSDSYATIYTSKLKLTDFQVQYYESSFGDFLEIKYMKTGSDEVMDDISKKLAKLPYTLLDSKTDPKAFESKTNAINVTRRIKLTDSNGLEILLVDMSNKNKISIDITGK